jgi:hypothetical protein
MRTARLPGSSRRRRVLLNAGEDELDELIGFVAAEANHEPNRRRRQRPDSSLLRAQLGNSQSAFEATDGQRYFLMEDKAEVYKQLGLRLTYGAAGRHRAVGPVGERRCRRTDRSHTPTGRRRHIRGRKSVSEDRGVLDAHAAAADGAGAGGVIVTPPRIPARPIALTGWSLMRLCPAVSLSRKRRKWHRASRALRSTSMTWARSEGHGARRTDYEQPTHIQREEESELPGLGELEVQPEHRCQAVVQMVASPPAPATQEQQLLTSGHPWD